MRQTHITGISDANRTANAADRRTSDTGSGAQNQTQGRGVRTARRGSRPRRSAAAALLLSGILAAMGAGISVGVLEAETCDRCTLGYGITTQGLRVVDTDGSISNARVKDVDGVTS
jgi:hypothetical protein